jgi:hypothetical protein
MDATDENEELAERLARLERRMDTLESLLAKGRLDAGRLDAGRLDAGRLDAGRPAQVAAQLAAPISPAVARESEHPPITAVPETVQPKAVAPIASHITEPPPDTGSIWRSEYWLHLTGIILLLFAVAFLFKYAIDQGWLTPAVRVFIGLLVGSGLLAAGLRLSARPRFSAMLLGGGIGAYYITGFAAFQLYQLLPHSVVFGFMVANTILAFALAVYGDQVALSLLAVAGGLATPFLLSTGAGEVTGLMAYTLLILTGAGAMYAYMGWQPLLWLAAVGGLMIIGVAVGLESWSGTIQAEAWPLQTGVVGWWLLFWLLPVARPSLRTKWPSLRAVNVGWQIVDQAAELGRLLRFDLFALTLVTPLVVLTFTAVIWPDLPSDNLGWAALALAAVSGLVAYLSSQREPGRLGLFHLAVAALLSTIGLSILLAGSALLLVLVGQAVILHLFAWYNQRRFALIIADLATALPALILLDRLLTSPTANWRPLDSAADLLPIAAAAIIAWKFRADRGRIGYALLAHVGLLLWFIRELDGSALLIALTVQVVAAQIVGYYRKSQAAVITADLTAILPAIILLERLLISAASDWRTLGSVADLAVIGAAAALAWKLRINWDRVIYALAAHIFLLIWFWRELGGLNDGQALVSVAWGVQAVVLLIAGLRFDLDKMRTTALATLALLVGKLFLVDLAFVNPLTRILLFFAFGGLFLALSYLVTRVWRPQRPSNPDSGNNSNEIQDALSEK